ncbi:serine--tRNA ligase [Candidatus Beckwithbacteria bacterium CG2_30_44_31]|uniref:Serine--tRNA ligase n=2 Tax=Bacteria candidate phyla TaxID=1783234 RepID=A0A1J5AXZ7_9BACT|nr:MAG: serine--tRNA ligase [Candidatus Beckwithbacteria bacterium CG2_30_44_31]
MLDIQFIRDNPDKVKKSTENKNYDPKIVDEVLALDKKRRELLQKIEALRAERNQLTRFDLVKGKKIKNKLKEFEPALKEIEKKLKELMYQLPNPAAKDVKAGKNEAENEVVRKWGKIRKFEFAVKDHAELGEKLGMIDIGRAAKVSGSRFAYLKGDGVRLEMALVNLALETLTKKGFIPVVPPVLIKTEMMQAMGYLEHGGDEQMYIFDKDNQVLVGTSEQAIGPLHSGEVFKAEDLPRRYMGWSTCFRREAGTYGKDTRGILRVHQFDKVEMFSFTKPEDSDKEHEFLLKTEEELLQALEIPYQVVKMCSGDLGAPAARKYDLEAWLPGQNQYRELTSTSSCTDFQARRLNIKFKDKDKRQYVHTLNGTGFAIGRTLIAIMENYQTKDGHIEIPKVLQKYIGKKQI